MNRTTTNRCELYSLRYKYNPPNSPYQGDFKRRESGIQFPPALARLQTDASSKVCAPKEQTA